MSTYGRPPRTVANTSVPPDPRVIRALGGHHTLTSALADLVDNSVDAGASHVLVRFLTDTDRPVGLMVVDDGRGMSTAELEKAMVYGGRRDYAQGDLGHYGVGMKASSLSQAAEMHVFTRKDGCVAAGRGLDADDLGTAAGPRVSSFDSADAAARLDDARVPFRLETGTVVQWLRPRGFSRADDPEETRRWLSTTRHRIGNELGMIFHRLIRKGTLTILLDDFDLAVNDSGIPEPVAPLDPFGYPKSGHPGFPDDLCSTVEGVPFCLSAAIWPRADTSKAEFCLGTRDGMARQGFYIYRNDRLLQAGGWNGLHEPTPDRMYARVAIELTHDLQPHVRLNSEKQGIEFTQGFVEAVRSSRSPDSGRTFNEYLEAAAGAAAQARKRQRRQELLVRPEGGGIAGAVYDAMEENFGFDPDQPGMDVSWEVLDPEKVFDIDMDGRTLRLNLRHRRALTGRAGTVSPANSPMLTTLLYLFARSEFKRVNSGTLWLETQQKWQNILLAAVKAQEDSDGGNPRSGRGAP
ncbi:histidine kinase/DNA gyrase B/HSP90-like ATPase [Kocuria rhizophila]|uniref:ATP-binding protein n=1 Tax=Kocuria rhizophila TaxID=72000 RepID=UPI00190E522F|nr:ATP-binding protein [Kocuria rhizophila]MBK4120236.1 ATP-binding protein [Kocuria rhizophila]MCC5672610.1 ATP-binding protein [Kocuria rhizophila]